MEHFDALTIIAELALGIAGFSGVVVALGTRPGAWPRVDRLRLATLLASSLGALLVTLVAMMLLMLTVSDALVWRMSSMLVAILLLVMLITIVPGAWSITRTTSELRSLYSFAVFIPTVVVAAITVLIQMSNAVGLITIDFFGVMFGGLVVLLIISGTQFVRLLFKVRDERENDTSRPIEDS